jgi:hypothetical protein
MQASGSQTITSRAIGDRAPIRAVGEYGKPDGGMHSSGRSIIDAVAAVWWHSMAGSGATKLWCLVSSWRSA